MVARKKTRLERFFSLNQHRKRFGASKLASQDAQENYAELKDKLVDAEQVVYTHGSAKNLEQHISDLREEFAGQPELIFHHAKLIVMLRREYKTEKHFELFQDLWSKEQMFLLENLNTRWLVSAADTLADFSRNNTERANALSVSLLINTIKAYETERYLQKAEGLTDLEDRMTRLSEGRVNFFDGTSALAVGTDDTIRNMRWRMEDVCNGSDSISSKILIEIFKRLQTVDNVYFRLKERHTRKKTAWW